MIYNFIVRNMNIINSIQSSLSNSLPWSLVDDHLLNFLQMISTHLFTLIQKTLILTLNVRSFYT